MVASIIAAAFFAGGCVVLFQVKETLQRLISEHQIPLRGMIKFLSQKNLSAQDEARVNLFYIGLLDISLAPCILVAGLSWATDYSFLIVLFPIVWYYYLIRFLFWEKSDLYDNKKNKDKDKPEGASANG